MSICSARLGEASVESTEVRAVVNKSRGGRGEGRGEKGEGRRERGEGRDEKGEMRRERVEMGKSRDREVVGEPRASTERVPVSSR